VVFAYQKNNEPGGSVKEGEFLRHLSDLQLLKYNSCPHTQTVTQ